MRMSIENPFKKIVPDADLPEGDREQVLDIIDSARFVMNFIDLFTVKQAKLGGTICQTLLESALDSKDKDTAKKEK